MSAGIRAHFRSNIVGYLALFVALGGTSYAVARNSVKSKHIAAGAVKKSDVNADHVQLRVKGECPAGQSIRVINGAGGVACELDDIGGGGGGGGAPSGPAGGDLAGSYPNPTVRSGAITGSKLGAITAQTEILTTPVANQQIGSINAFCPAGQRALSGGGYSDVEGQGVLLSSRPIESPNDFLVSDGETFSGWRVSAWNGFNEPSVNPEVWVICIAG